MRGPAGSEQALTVATSAMHARNLLSISPLYRSGRVSRLAPASQAQSKFTLEHIEDMEKTLLPARAVRRLGLAAAFGGRR